KRVAEAGGESNHGVWPTPQPTTANSSPSLHAYDRQKSLSGGGSVRIRATLNSADLARARRDRAVPSRCSPGVPEPPNGSDLAIASIHGSCISGPIQREVYTSIFTQTNC